MVIVSVEPLLIMETWYPNKRTELRYLYEKDDIQAWRLSHELWKMRIHLLNDCVYYEKNFGELCLLWVKVSV